MRPARTPLLQSRLNFAQAFNPNNNAFGFLRLILAVSVIFSHSFPLGGFGVDGLESFTKGQYTIGLVSVAMFFVLSGFLICRSALNSPSVPRFLWHRFLRIYPGYWMCLVVCACVFAPLIALAEFGEFWKVFFAPRNSPQSYMLGNVGLLHLNGFSIGGFLFIEPASIAGLLHNNPMRGIFNGSLWTLPFEVTCYLAVATLAAVGVLRRARWVVLGLFTGLWGLYAFDCIDPEGFCRCFPYPGIRQLVMLCLFFSAGCLCFLYREKIPHSFAAFVISLIVLGVSLPVGMFGLVAPVAMTYAFLWLAFTFPLRRFDKRGDFSYGLYIYAFPVQQGLVTLRIHEEGFGAYFLCSLLLTSVLAFLSYRLIEAPCLRLKTLTIPAFWRRTKSPVAQLIESGSAPTTAPAAP